MKDQANALGAAGVQIGTAYLRCPEAHISELHRTALKKPEPATVITNVLTGRPAGHRRARAAQCRGPGLPARHPSRDPAQDKCRQAGVRPFFVLLVRGSSCARADMNAEDLTRTISEESLALLRSLSAPKRE
jgi:nitronate monooxygenase